MSGVTVSFQSRNITDWDTKVTSVPGSEENVTFFDYVDQNETSTVHDVGDLTAEMLKIPAWFIIIMVSISAWIIITNGLVFLCFITSRGALKKNVNIQLLSLSLSDMLVGICTVPVTYVLIDGHPSTFESCAFVTYMYIMSQGANLWHTLVICINRLLAIRKKTNVSKNESFKRILLQIVAVWAGCLLYYTVHFLAFARYGETVERCSIYHLFEDSHLLASRLLTSPLLVPAQLCANIIYGYLFIYIREKLGVDVGQKLLSKDTCIRQKQNRIQEKPSSGSNTDYDTDISNRVPIASTSSVTLESGGNADSTQTKIRPINEQAVGPSTDDKSKYNSNNNPASIATIAMAKGDNGGVQSEMNRIRLKRQRRVLVTFGILLIALNLFMTPMSFLAVIEILLNRPLSRTVRWLFVTMGMLNSALNPVINIWRMPPFRAIMKEKATKLIQLLACKFYRK